MCANTQALLLHINTGSFVQLLLIYLSNDQKARENDLQKQIFTAYRVTVVHSHFQSPILSQEKPQFRYIFRVFVSYTITQSYLVN